jgi:hypothetical protein
VTCNYYNRGDKPQRARRILKRRKEFTAETQRKRRREKKVRKR